MPLNTGNKALDRPEFIACTASTAGATKTTYGTPPSDAVPFLSTSEPRP